MVVFDSADPDFFFPHVDLTQSRPNTPPKPRRPGVRVDASLGTLFRKLSQIPAVTLAKLRGRTRAGSEFLLACDMRFASRETAALGQPEVGIGAPPGAGAIQHLTRLLGRGRALEAVLTSADLMPNPPNATDGSTARARRRAGRFVAGLAARIGGSPRDALIAAKAAIDAISLPAPADVHGDAAFFQQLVRGEATQQRTAALFKRGFQTRSRTELDLGDSLGQSTKAVN